MQKEINNIISSFLDSKADIDFSPNELYMISQKLCAERFQDEIIHSFLELGHLSHINKIFNESEICDKWLSNLFILIKKSQYHTGIMLQQRAERYPDKILFQSVQGDTLTKITFSDAWNRVKQIGSLLINLINNSAEPIIGIYGPNSLENVLIDLACLSFNIKIVPIPANISEEHLKYVINHSNISHLFIGGDEQLDLIDNISSRLENKSYITLSTLSSDKINNTPWSEFLSPKHKIDNKELDKRLKSTQMDDDATIMYTSGTTANPKGIIFTQQNIVAKRFARALALPDINSDDTFLCYLPLYHTFGRYLEMMGCIFWGATYTFAESPAFNTLVKNMKIVKPSIFISIPKRWLQLYEFICSMADTQIPNKDDIAIIVANSSGGNLRLGLSAAGYLDPDIFIFFHKYNIQLLSGYGMTEATGGITMTPQNKYIRDSVGRSLPGIELKLAEDNELLMKGEYVTSYYHGKVKDSSLKNGWFHTGDIFDKKNDHFYIVDRKKEIYKNSRGITISPQKIENLFQDFDAIKSVFLIGDGMPYNTVLLYPNTDWIKSIDDEKDFELNEYFSSLLQSVNSFLAPYERIVNFTFIDRDFSDKKGELTPKKTYKRKKILKNFAEFISPMYEKDYYSLLHNSEEIRIPKWLLRKSGVLSNNLLWNGKILTIRGSKRSLTVELSNSNAIIGNFNYAYSNSYFNIKKLIISPELWLGNQEFVDFFGFSALKHKHFEQLSEIHLDNTQFRFNQFKVDSKFIDELKIALRDKIYNLNTIHIAAIIVYNEFDYYLAIAIHYLSKILSSDKYHLVDLAVKMLTKLRDHPSFKTRVKALEIVTPNISGELFVELLSEIFVNSDETSIIEDLTLDTRVIKRDHFKHILIKSAILRNYIVGADNQKIIFAKALINTISNYGIFHPTEYRWARTELIKWQLSAGSEQLKSLASIMLESLTVGFRNWLGPIRNIAIDHESGEEYSWEDVITFDPNVPSEFKDKLFSAISNTQILKEAIFLLSKYRLIALDDIQLHGVWIMIMGNIEGVCAFRVTIQTRENVTYNFVLKTNGNESQQFILDEINLLITTGSSSHGNKLVEDFGGFWSDFNIFTEEYVPGETVFQYLERNRNTIKSKEKSNLWQLRWMHFIWNGAMAYFSFYQRSNFNLYIGSSYLKNIIIPEYDYAIGTRLVSILNKIKVENISSIFLSLYKGFIIDTEMEYEGLEHVADWEVLFCALLQTITVKEGIEQLEKLIDEIEDGRLSLEAKKYKLTVLRIQKFINDVNENGLLTKPVVFASLRYERWLELNNDATLEARGAMMRQLYIDYNLSDLIDDYPETRIRFFLMTAFKDSDELIKNELLKLQIGLRAKTISVIDLDKHINYINNKFELSASDDYFLARLIFEHIDSDNTGKEFVWDSVSDGKLELITAVSDSIGENHQIRQPIHPKEIAKFQTLLLNSNLTAIFNHQHEFLLIINSSNQLIGGVYWTNIDEKTAHLERIVVIPKYRNRHLSSLLLDELFNRLKNKRFSNITVGFFQAGLFYNKGFYIDKQFGGLVKKLD